MGKHAYLVIANRNFDQLALLLNLLDDPRNDVYLLIDAKSEREAPTFSLKHSNLYRVPGIPIYWGDYSQIKAEMTLFSSATKQATDYDYFHLLSGLDLPLATQDEIHAFFDKNPRREFITYSAMASQSDLRLRLRQHLLRHHYRTNSKNFFVKAPLTIFRKLESAYLKVTDHSSSLPIEFGSNWVSLSNDFVQKIVLPENLQLIRDTFSKGFLVDELLIPFMVNKLGFQRQVYSSTPVHDQPNEFQGNIRYINWWDGYPYTWREKDFKELQQAKQMGHLFARKFDSLVDKKIIELVINSLIKSEP